MKWNWGTKLWIFICIYLICIVSMVIFMATQSINLVTEDYYPKGMNYQQQIDKMNNTVLFDKEISVSQTNDFVKLKFPKTEGESNYYGKVYFYRPSNYKNDQNFTLALNADLQQSFSKEDMIRGLYILKVDWHNDTTAYYFEKRIYINK